MVKTICEFCGSGTGNRSIYADAARHLGHQVADAFVSLPGGIGTLDETFEAWTWNQLGYHSKPVALLNVEGFYNALGTFLDGVTEEGFLKIEMRRSLIVESNPTVLLDRLENWRLPAEDKWA